MDIGTAVFINLIMATVTSMVAGSKRGGGAGVLFFFYALFLWPIALAHALLMKAPAEAAIRAEGFVNGKPYWSDGKGGFIARVDGRDLAFKSEHEIQMALGGDIVPLAQEGEELIGQKLVRKITSL